jgi:hypothetical protein
MRKLSIVRQAWSFKGSDCLRIGDIQLGGTDLVGPARDSATSLEKGRLKDVDFAAKHHDEVKLALYRCGGLD